MYLPVAVLMGIAVVSVLVVNGFVIMVSIRYKKLQSPLNYILVNLAVADLLVTLCGSPVSFSNNINGFFMFGKPMCELEAFMVSLTGKDTNLETCLGLWLVPLHLAKTLWGMFHQLAASPKGNAFIVKLMSFSYSLAQGRLK